jgi:hypothetical protein
MPLWPIPFARFELITSLSPGQALERLAASIEREWRREWLGRATRPFAGNIVADCFTLRRIIYYHNSFLPRIQGRVVPAAHGGSKVVGTMSLDPLVGAFLVFVCLLILCVSFSPSLWRDPSERIMFPLLLIGFCYLLSTAGFCFETARARRLLAEIVEAEQTPHLTDTLDG